MTNTYAIEINKEMVLSPCHVQESTFASDFLSMHDYSDDVCTTRMHVEICLYHYENPCKGCVVVTFPPELVNLLQIAKAHNCKWLVLDCDAEETQGLPKFDW